MGQDSGDGAVKLKVERVETVKVEEVEIGLPVYTCSPIDGGGSYYYRMEVRGDQLVVTTVKWWGRKDTNAEIEVQMFPFDPDTPVKRGSYLHPDADLGYWIERGVFDAKLAGVLALVTGECKP